MHPWFVLHWIETYPIKYGEGCATANGKYPPSKLERFPNAQESHSASNIASARYEDKGIPQPEAEPLPEFKQCLRVEDTTGLCNPRRPHTASRHVLVLRSFGGLPLGEPLDLLQL